MHLKAVLLFVALLHQYVTIVCDDIQDCERCSTYNLFIENISTESTAKRCWILRTHLIQYCNMCLRRCCASYDLDHHNPICASTEPDWHRHKHGRRIFYNECAYFRYICEVEKPARSLLWKCMFRRPWDHEDCDASPGTYENGRHKPRLHIEKHPPRINCDRFAHLPELSPCTSRKATPAPSTTPIPTTTTRPTTTASTTKSTTTATTTIKPTTTATTTTKPTTTAAPMMTTEIFQLATTEIIVTKLETNTPPPNTNTPPPPPPPPPNANTPPPPATVSRDVTTTNEPVTTTKVPFNQPTTPPVTESTRRTPKLPLPIGASPNPSKHSLGRRPTPESRTKNPSEGVTPAQTKPTPSMVAKTSTPSFPVRTFTVITDGTGTKLETGSESESTRTPVTTQMLFTTKPNTTKTRSCSPVDRCSCELDSSLCTSAVRTKGLQYCEGRVTRDTDLKDCWSCYGRPPPTFPCCLFPQTIPR